MEDAFLLPFRWSGRPPDTPELLSIHSLALWRSGRLAVHACAGPTWVWRLASAWILRALIDQQASSFP